tara:strand:+ start:200 stop:1159 length:960 start_codon:yes stop_codon:yes gene_type:complete
MNNKNINKNINYQNLYNMIPVKNHTVFLIVIIILILTFIIFIIRNHLNHLKFKQKFVKNVFFMEMDDIKNKPFDASKQGSSNKYDLDKKICVRGKANDNYIPNEALHVQIPYLLMFWFNLNSNKIGNKLKVNTNASKFPLVYFSNKRIHTDTSQKFYPLINIDILKNELNVNVNNCIYDTSSNNDSACGKSEKLFNIPSDTWTCISAVVDTNHLNLYLNGKLMKVIEYTKLNSNNLSNFKMYVGPFPGEIAYLQVNNDSKYFNSNSIYEEYVYFKEKIRKYVENEYHKHYKISTLTDHSNYDFSKYHYRPKEDKLNKCN